MATFKLNMKGLKIDTKLLDIKKYQKVIQQELENVNARLTANVQAGKDSKGGKLKPYSKSYRDAINAGNVRGKADTRVNLTQTGKMLRSKQIQEVPGGGKIVFTGGHSSGLSAKQLAKIQLEMRPGWHQLSKKDKKRIQDRIDSLTEKIANNIVKRR
jgi:hypothetical protein